MARSPSSTWIRTPGCWSEYVVKVCVCLVGMVVFRLIRGVMTPPAVSMPSDSGATSRSSRSWTLADVSPLRMAACTAAPYATASSGLMLLFSSRPWNRSCRSFWILGMRVEPPTSTMSWIWLLSILASLRAFSTGSRVPRKRSEHSSSKRALRGVPPPRMVFEGVYNNAGMLHILTSVVMPFTDSAISSGRVNGDQREKVCCAGTEETPTERGWTGH
ncbi:hypothetical protein CRUP_029431 [Coryphaenoides rupestris]|nr:hypothetical protein CRUP_029431 [Coryphaenoides rupestris]